MFENNGDNKARRPLIFYVVIVTTIILLLNAFIFPMMLARQIQVIGPSTGSMKKLRDLFRFVIYIKAEKYDTLIVCKDLIEKTETQGRQAASIAFRHVEIQFDFDPVNPF